ncbi:MAG: Ig-like domain-containing protein, partial [Verrucomicrobiota bacterium]
LAGLPAHGTLSGTAPNLVYTPAAGYSNTPAAPDTFTYKVKDGAVESAPALVRVNVKRLNRAPVAEAGPDQTVIFPALATLAGTVRDDGLPEGVALTTTWSKVSGPGDVRFNNASIAATGVAFAVPGTYVLRLGVTDSEKSASDEVTITVNVANKPPVVDAGPARRITHPSHATLAGSVVDDGLPSGGTLTQSWHKVSGPGTVTFSQPDKVATEALFSAPGEYVLRLIANDGALSGRADVTVSVMVPNAAPTVDAGPPQVIAFGDAANLLGVANDDGLPVTGTLNVSWSKASGPGPVSFGNANQAVTSAAFTVPGVYMLTLSASDSLLSASANVVVTVNAPNNAAPLVDAGPDQSFTLGNAARLNGRITDDGMPANSTPTVEWTKISGPGVATFSAGTAAVTEV